MLILFIWTAPKIKHTIKHHSSCQTMKAPIPLWSKKLAVMIDDKISEKHSYYKAYMYEKQKKPKYALTDVIFFFQNIV